MARSKCRICHPTAWEYADMDYFVLLRKWQFYDRTQRHDRETYGAAAQEMILDLEEKKRTITRAMAKMVFG